MFDNDRKTSYVSATEDSKNRKIEIVFNEPIFLDKIVLMKSNNFMKGFELFKWLYTML